MLASEDAAGQGKGADRGAGRIVAVYSGKGGVGRTSISVNLASLLASEHHRRVVAVDMDLQYGDVASVIPTPDEYPSIADLAAATPEEIDADFAATAMVPGPGGFHVIACPPRPELSELVTPAHVTRLMAVLPERFDVVIVDCDSHLSDVTTAVTDVADTILLVATPTTPSLKSLRLALRLFEQLGVAREKLVVVLNHPDEHSDFSDEDVVSNLGHRVAVSLPHDSRSAVMAIDTGEPFVFTRPRSALTAGLKKLAADIAASTSASEERRGLMGMLSGRS